MNHMRRSRQRCRSHFATADTVTWTQTVYFTTNVYCVCRIFLFNIKSVQNKYQENLREVMTRRATLLFSSNVCNCWCLNFFFFPESDHSDWNRLGQDRNQTSGKRPEEFSKDRILFCILNILNTSKILFKIRPWIPVSSCK